MKNTRIHLIWGLVAIGLSVGVGFYIASRKDEDFRSRQVDYERRLSRIKSTFSDLREERETSVPTSGGSISEASAEPDGDLAQSPEDRLPERFRGGREDRREPATLEMALGWLKSEDRGAYWRVVGALRDLKDPKEKMTLIKAILETGDGRMISRALDVLDDIGGPEAMSIAVNQLQNAESYYIRAKAASILGRMGGATGEVLAALDDAFRDENLRVKTSAANALLRLGHPARHQEIVVDLAGALDHADGAQREDSVRYLARLGTASVLPYLGEALNDPNSDVRSEAVEGLEDTGLEEAIPYLERAVNDPVDSVAKEAKRAIERIQNPEEESDDRRR